MKTRDIHQAPKSMSDEDQWIETKQPDYQKPKILVRLTQCSKASCGHVMTESEHVWVPDPRWKGSRTGTCPKCGNNSFYSLNALGQKRSISDTGPREIAPEDIEPSPRMGLKMKRRILAAKRRAIEANQ